MAGPRSLSKGIAVDSIYDCDLLGNDYTFFKDDGIYSGRQTERDIRNQYDSFQGSQETQLRLGMTRIPPDVEPGLDVLSRTHRPQDGGAIQDEELSGIWKQEGKNLHRSLTTSQHRIKNPTFS